METVLRRWARGRRGRLAELARNLGVGLANLSSYTDGDRVPEKYRVAMAEAAGLSVGEAFDGLGRARIA